MTFKKDLHESHGLHKLQSKTLLTCEGFEDRVHLILDDRLTLTGDARLLEHAAQCHDCEIKLLEYDSFDDSLSFLKQNFAEVTCIVDEEGTESPLYRPLAALAALAAMLLVCLNFFGDPSSQHSGDFAQRVEIKEPASIPAPAVVSQLAATGSAFSLNVPLASRSRAKNRVTPDSSPFSPNFRVADNIPRLPSAPDWETVSKPFETLEPVLTYSAELPCIKTIQSTLNVTIELLRRSLNSKPSSDVDIGLGQRFLQPSILA